MLLSNTRMKLGPNKSPLLPLLGETKPSSWVPATHTTRAPERAQAIKSGSREERLIRRRYVHFADDTTLSQNLAFFSGANLTRSQMERRINAELSNVYDWLCVNKLSLNVSKSRCMIFKNRKIDIVSMPWNIEINGENVECVSEFNFLGILLDEFLSWIPHTKKVCSKISRTLGVIKRVRRILPFSALKSLYNAPIVPHLNYGIKLWHSNSHSVNIMQKRAIRVISSKKFFHHTSGLFKEHKLLKLDDIFKLQCLKMFFKIENNLCSN